MIPALAFWFVGFSSIGTMPLLECPACTGGLCRRLKRYCPACGSVKLERGTGSLSAHCNACKKELWAGKHSNYKIRFCTHCGIPLDEKGL